MQPRDVIAHGPHLPTLVAGRRNQHRQVGLAASRREGAGQVVNLTLRIFDADDEHVLRQPAFGARLPTGDAQGVTLFAEQGVAAVAGAEALDGEFFRKMHDETAFGIEVPGGMQSPDERAIARHALERRPTHARHEAHVEHDIGAVGDLDSAPREGRVDRTHAVRHHIQGAPLHAACEQCVHLRMRLARLDPVVVRARVLFVLGANEGQMLDSCHVRGGRARQHAAGKALRIQGQQLLVGDQFPLQRLELRVAAVAPMYLLRLREFRDVRSPRPRHPDSWRRELRAAVLWPLAIPRRKLDRSIRMTDGCWARQLPSAREISPTMKFILRCMKISNHG